MVRQSEEESRLQRTAEHGDSCTARGSAQRVRVCGEAQGLQTVVEEKNISVLKLVFWVLLLQLPRSVAFRRFHV